MDGWWVWGDGLKILDISVELILIVKNPKS